jgi:hypothetical protein
VFDIKELRQEKNTSCLMTQYRMRGRGADYLAGQLKTFGPLILSTISANGLIQWCSIAPSLNTAEEVGLSAVAEGDPQMPLA